MFIGMDSRKERHLTSIDHRQDFRCNRVSFISAILPALVAETLHSNVDAVSPVPQSSLKFGPHVGQEHRIQALDLPTGVALKMGMRRAVLTGQLIVGHPALQGEAAHHASLRKVLKNAIHCHFVDPAAGTDGLYDLLGS